MQVEQGGLAYTLIHPDELRRRMSFGEVFSFVDARSDDSYRRSGRTVATAVRIPPEDLPARQHDIQRGKTLVLIADHDRAESMAFGLLSGGFTDVYLIDGGFDAYVRAGGPTEPARL